ncbi:MAG: 23S rRNA (pseudouridine(1915)-N(3))-methyltransferase RlmH [Candidatus Muproteobacteria bacterium RBG_16_65_34]|uniref:Ribosomal RNA large subunit methyltransferase H n=1 Tax=Candidatus Muproteobacteria bacterium RBG_16_65_34 TaxID=1817760 RepID=A0A1F6TT52_9PROT|nr:MAG: 23S rRNA (pseudouridine(1915)-N(3))-methyltransferase RlmH [Candidatus Muproteobacteria bacterium RBG_16_65_34]
MQIHIIAVGNRMPEWVEAGFEEYAKRLPRECRLVLREIPAGKRAKGADIARVVRAEGERLLAAVPKGARVAALERTGRELDTEGLAAELKKQLARGGDLALLIGGPEGLSEESLKRADARWSLSQLTLAHPLVRVVLAEQLYRAWSIIKGLPYHR